MTYPTDNEIRKEFEKKFGNLGSFKPDELDVLEMNILKIIEIRDFLLTTRSNDRKAIVEMVKVFKDKGLEWAGSENGRTYSRGYNEAVGDIITKLTELG